MHIRRTKFPMARDPVSHCHTGYISLFQSCHFRKIPVRSESQVQDSRRAILVSADIPLPQSPFPAKLAVPRVPETFSMDCGSPSRKPAFFSFLALARIATPRAANSFNSRASLLDTWEREKERCSRSSFLRCRRERERGDFNWLHNSFCARLIVCDSRKCYGWIARMFCVTCFSLKDSDLITPGLYVFIRKHRSITLKYICYSFHVWFNLM